MTPDELIGAAHLVIEGNRVLHPALTIEEWLLPAAPADTPQDSVKAARERIFENQRGMLQKRSIHAVFCDYASRKDLPGTSFGVPGTGVLEPGESADGWGGLEKMGLDGGSSATSSTSILSRLRRADN